MIALDTSGWIELLTDGPNATVFREPLERDKDALVSALSVYEVTKVLLRQFDEVRAAAGVTAMTKHARLVPVDGDIAARGASTALTTGLSMADAIILATARWHFAELWTQDADFDGLEGVRYIPRAS